MYILAFDVGGDFGHFRKFFTTSSPLTYPFPPPPTVRGMVGAILGLKKEEYLKKTEDIELGIRLLKPVKKTRMTINYIYTKGGSGKFDPTLNPLRKADRKTLRTQVKVEFLRNPAFRIYISWENEELFTELRRKLENHESYYTFSLGLSELLGDFSFVGIFEAKKGEKAEKINTVIPLSEVIDLDLERLEGRIGKERIPVYMSQDRQVLRYEDVIFNVDGKPLYGQFKNVWLLNNGEVVYLWRSQKSQGYTPTRLFS